jgi:hypothetical protein
MALVFSLCVAGRTSPNGANDSANANPRVGAVVCVSTTVATHVVTKKDGKVPAGSHLDRGFEAWLYPPAAAIVSAPIVTHSVNAEYQRSPLRARPPPFSPYLA